MILVRYTKLFTKGNLIGLSYEEQIRFAELEQAVNFINQVELGPHPIKAVGSSDYEIISAYIENNYPSIVGEGV